MLYFHLTNDFCGAALEPIIPNISLTRGSVNVELIASGIYYHDDDGGDDLDDGGDDLDDGGDDLDDGGDDGDEICCISTASILHHASMDLKGITRRGRCRPRIHIQGILSTSAWTLKEYQ